MKLLSSILKEHKKPHHKMNVLFKSVALLWQMEYDVQGC